MVLDLQKNEQIKKDGPDEGESHPAQALMRVDGV
jgi:hypothetical protein